MKIKRSVIIITAAAIIGMQGIRLAAIEKHYEQLQADYSLLETKYELKNDQFERTYASNLATEQLYREAKERLALYE